MVELSFGYPSTTLTTPLPPFNTTLHSSANVPVNITRSTCSLSNNCQSWSRDIVCWDSAKVGRRGRKGARRIGRSARRVSFVWEGGWWAGGFVGGFWGRAQNGAMKRGLLDMFCEKLDDLGAMIGRLAQ